ncbi:MAG TPA: tRNA uridine-5-carboxymethylaminomethyl(34) synthesis GTPase MnmE [Elusimicrobiales bacterium]|nr:tRNA uridine-5-carboxymethylaminomethyl(34) synthesis GTPase MnmE [Elusimicrobiales bacterium]
MKTNAAADTIAALSTPPGAGALALLRVSGPRASEICCSILRTPSGNKTALEHQKAVPALVLDGKNVLDKVVAVYFKGPQSYTGEDTVELSCHGSPYIKASLLELLLKAGARPAQPGEYTCRAFLNGKLDLAQAEGIADLISSASKAEHRAALDAAEGRLSREFSDIKQSLVEHLAQLEARLDDADGEMAAFDAPALASQLKHTAARLARLANTHKAGRYIKEGVRACIAGAPNAGKSSLLNALAGFDRAIVSPQPGTTRDTIEETLNIDGHKFLLIDTAGLREQAHDSTEGEGMQRTRRTLEQADLVLLVEDAAFPSPEAARARKYAQEQLRLRATPVIFIGNKADLPSATAEEGRLSVSCKTGQGLQELRHKMTQALNLEETEKDGFVITSARQHRALSSAAKLLGSAARELEKEAPALELCADGIYAALEELQQLIGATAPEEILDAIFSKFCVGK